MNGFDSSVLRMQIYFFNFVNRQTAYCQSRFFSIAGIKPQSSHDSIFPLQVFLFEFLLMHEDNAEWLDFITSVVDLSLFGCRLSIADSFKIRTIIIKIIQSPSCDRLSNVNRNWLSKTIQLIYLQCAVRLNLLNCFLKVRLLLGNSLKQTVSIQLLYIFIFLHCANICCSVIFWNNKTEKNEDLNEAHQSL